jgi:hypothetical protein
MKPEELIEKESAGIYNTNEPIIPKSKALESVSIARKEEKERAFKVLEFMLEDWVHGGDAEGFLKEFKEELEAKK